MNTGNTMLRPQPPLLWQQGNRAEGQPSLLAALRCHWPTGEMPPKVCHAALQLPVGHHAVQGAPNRCEASCSWCSMHITYITVHVAPTYGYAFRACNPSLLAATSRHAYSMVPCSRPRQCIHSTTPRPITWPPAGPVPANHQNRPPYWSGRCTPPG